MKVPHKYFCTTVHMFLCNTAPFFPSLSIMKSLKLKKSIIWSAAAAWMWRFAFCDFGQWQDKINRAAFIAYKTQYPIHSARQEWVSHQQEFLPKYCSLVVYFLSFPTPTSSQPSDCLLTKYIRVSLLCQLLRVPACGYL